MTILNEYQQAVIDACAVGPQVVEAAPGSGKTRTLESLVATLVRAGADPAKIGVFTFSNQAAAEARRRIARTLWPELTQDELDFFEWPYENRGLFDNSWIDDDPARRMLVDWVCTIHALSLRLLKEMGDRVRVLSGKEEWQAKSLIEDSLAEIGWDESARTIRNYVALAIKNLITPPKAYEFYSRVLAGSDVSWRARDLAEIFRRYYDFCRSRHLVDFEMMQARVLWRLQNDPDWMKKAQEKFNYVLVDEAQDNDSIQAIILWTLAQRTRNIVFCGDVDQSMYAFRGARPELMRSKFEMHWPDVKRFNLPINYRSTKQIIRAATRLIQNNYDGPDDPYLKPFDSRPDAPEGEPVTSSKHHTFGGLCSQVAEMTKEQPGDWFVLSRTRAECAAIHTELLRQGIPAINKSGGMLFGAPHVRKVLAYARLACNYQNARDDQEILSEIANVATVDFRAPFTKRNHRKGCHNNKGWIDCGCPTIMVEGEDYVHSRFYGQKAVEAAGNWDGILTQCYEQNRGGYPTTRAKGANDLVRFVNRLEKLAGDARACLNMVISDCVLPWLEVEYGNGEDLAENGRAEDFGLLLGMVNEEGQTMEQYLDEVESLSQSGNGHSEQESVILGTAHWSKGAERERVFCNITRLPIIAPAQKPGKLPVGRPSTIEEERRLLFVMITRAKTQVHVGWSIEWDGMVVEESPFVSELGFHRGESHG